MPTQTRQTDLLNSTPKSSDPTPQASQPSAKKEDEHENENETEHPSKVTGQYHSMKGSLVEAIGNTTGSEAWKEAGRREYEQGQRELEDAEQLFPIE